MDADTIDIEIKVGDDLMYNGFIRMKKSNGKMKYFFFCCSPQIERKEKKVRLLLDRERKQLSADDLRIAARLPGL